MGFDLTVSIPALTVFLQGLLSFFSPCVLPLIPLYFGYLSGGAAAEGEGGRFSRGKVLVNTVFFVLGVSFAFFLLGLGMTALGSFLGRHQTTLARVGGVVVIFFGLYQLGLFGGSILDREARFRLPLQKLAMSPLTALLMGFVFSFAWTPCVGPALSSVLLMAASAASRAKGFLLIAVYTLGFVLPFLAVGLFTTSLLGLFSRHMGVVKWTAKVGGVLLIVMGLMMITGTMNSITGYLSRLGAAPETTQTETAEPTPPPTTEPATETEPESEHVYPAPELSFYDQYGQLQTLSDYRGKVVFLNFWATWCPPCRAEMPDIQALYETYSAAADSDVVILAVATPGVGGEEDEEGVKAFLEENGYTYPVLLDPTGQSLSDYAISAYPTTFMIDREGNLYGYVTGSITREIMDSIIEQTLAGK